ncbi:MAG: phage minor capsid protein [Oscillospiraceae bacterium]|nr:phage minor capsid protein [Oscillospiraceae bacterium]
MFTPEYLRDFPDYLVTLVEQYDAFVIQDFSRRVAKAASVTETAAWQAERAKEFGLSMEELTKKSSELTKISQSALKQMLEEASDTYLASENERLGASGLNFERVMNSPVLRNYLSAVYQQTSGQMRNITGTTATGLIIGGKYRSMRDSYLMALDLAQMQVSSGVLDYNTAVRNAIRSISSTGVSTMTNDAVQYDSGYHLSVRSAARMCVRTGANQIAGKYNEFIADYFELDLVETTAHLGARPSHQDWQGQIFSRSGNSKKYPPLSDTGYGQVDGLMGANCRHNFYAYAEGTPRAYTDKQLYKMSDAGAGTTTYDGKTYTYYEATQKQRQIERQIIKTKRELIGYSAAGDTEAFTTASIKLSTQRDKYRNFSKAAGLRQRWERSQQDGYDRSLSGKSVWAVRKATK